MKTMLRVALVALSCAVGLGVSPTPRPTQAATSVSVSFFYGSLAPYGRWVEVESYGRCWAPAGVGHGWRPYSDGYWAYTEYGWTWVENEPWGWATYHYGRWFYDDYYGWLWVPGTVWAPAWVAWRASDDYVGWCPLPPYRSWRSSYGIAYSTTFVERIPSSYWCFVPTRSFVDRRVSSWILPRERNVTAWRQTRNATRLSVRDGHVVNAGISPQRYRRYTGRSVQRHDLVPTRSRGRTHRIGDNRIAAYQPTISGVRGAERQVARRERVDRSRGPSFQRERAAPQRRERSTERFRREASGWRDAERRGPSFERRSPAPERGRRFESSRERGRRFESAPDRGRRFESARQSAPRRFESARQSAPDRGPRFERRRESPARDPSPRVREERRHDGPPQRQDYRQRGADQGPPRRGGERRDGEQRRGGGKPHKG